MTSQTPQTNQSQDYPVRPQIFNLWTTNKTCLIIEDATSLDDPKLRFALLPANGNDRAACDFYLNVHEARALMDDLKSGQLSQIASRSNKDNDPEKGFDRYAKTNQGGYRTLTIKNKGEELGILIVKCNGDREYQKVFMDQFQAKIMALAVLAFLASLDATKLARVQE